MAVIDQYHRITIFLTGDEDLLNTLMDKISKERAGFGSCGVAAEVRRLRSVS